MHTNLTLEEKQQLQNNFRVLFELESNEVAIPFQRLLDEDELYPYLKRLEVSLGSDQLLVLGSQFMKRLGFLLTIPAFYSLAVFNKKLNMDFVDLDLVPQIKGRLWMPHLYKEQWEAEPIRNRADRNAYLKDSIEQISQMIRTVHNVAKVPDPLLWENVAGYIYWLYETRLQATNLSLHERKEAWNDFAYLLQLKPEIFHERFNPFHRFYTNKIEVKGNDEPIRVRRTCCFYYEAEDGEKYCAGCPKSDVNKEACMTTKRHVLPIEMIQ